MNDATAAQGLLASISHDVCHDGKGNTIEDKHYPFRLEQIAINKVRSWIAPPCEAVPHINQSLPLIYATDVSGVSSPAKIVRAWYDHRYERGREPSFPIPEQLRPIVSNRRLTLAAALLQDADVLSSVLDNDTYAMEAARHNAELKRPPSPAGELFFIDNNLEGRMTTFVGQSLANEFIQSKRQEYLAALIPG